MPNALQTVFAVDDDADVLTSLARLLEIEGLAVAPFASARDFLERCHPAMQGCLILDLAMPELDGLELQQALAAQGCTLPVIFLTGRGDIRSSVQAMKLGAVDFLTKPIEDEALLTAVHAAFERDEASRRARSEQAEIGSRFAALTPREREVLDHVVAGRRNKQIAAALGTVEKTVKFHRGNVMRKVGVRSVAELVRLVERLEAKPSVI